MNKGMYDFEKLVVTGCGTVFTANGIWVLTGLTEEGQPCDSPYPVVSTWLIDNVGLHQERLSLQIHRGTVGHLREGFQWTCTHG
jgi:hypothetical protein